MEIILPIVLVHYYLFMIQIAAWDANLFAPHKRMGNTAVDLGSLCDGEIPIPFYF